MPEDETEPFEPIELEVVDLIVARRTVAVESPFCPNCGADLRERGALRLNQYEFSSQDTDILLSDWESSDIGEDHLPLAWSCTACEQAIAEGSES